MNKQRNIVENPVENEKEIEMSDINDKSTVVEKQHDGQDNMQNQTSAAAEGEVNGGTGAYYVEVESKWVVEKEEPFDNAHENPLVLSGTVPVYYMYVQM